MLISGFKGFNHKSNGYLLSAVSFSVIIVLLSNDLKPFDHIIFCLGEGRPEKSCCQWILSGKSHHQSQVTLT